VGYNSPGYTAYGAGGGYSSDINYYYYDRVAAQPGVLILKYPSN
jgi:hypothetical protein